MTVWLGQRLILAVHDEQLRAYGGAPGIRDGGLLESALARPLNAAAYGEPDTIEFAALYVLGIARNHPFLDGNKRTAYVALETFLRLNGMACTATDAESVVAMIDMAAGELTDSEFTLWVRDHTAPR